MRAFRVRAVIVNEVIMDFELVSEESVPALDVRIEELELRLLRFVVLADRARQELRAAKAARTAVRGIAKN